MNKLHLKHGELRGGVMWMETFDFVLKPLHVWYGKMLERTALVVVGKDQLAVLHLALSEQFLIGHAITEHRTIN